MKWFNFLNFQLRKGRYPPWVRGRCAVTSSGRAPGFPRQRWCSSAVAATSPARREWRGRWRGCTAPRLARRPRCADTNSSATLSKRKLKQYKGPHYKENSCAHVTRCCDVIVDEWWRTRVTHAAEITRQENEAVTKHKNSPTMLTKEHIFCSTATRFETRIQRFVFLSHTHTCSCRSLISISTVKKSILFFSLASFVWSESTY